MGDAFAEIANGGPLLLAVGAALVAGLISFLSPCVLPLIPGYLSYVTGLAGADLDATRADPVRQGVRAASDDGRAEESATAGSVAVAVAPRRPARRTGRVLAGTLLFVAGYTTVFILIAMFFASVGGVLVAHRRLLEIIIGTVVVLLGLAFLGVVPGMQREYRINWLPAAGLLGAPALGAVFALSWVPCATPTLGAVLGLATVSGQPARAVILAVAYCLGSGLPFVAFGLGFRRLLGVFRAARRNSRWVTRAGGALLIIVGLALITGGWGSLVIWLQSRVGPIGFGI